MRPWSQEIEDAYRGVDGRKVTDYNALFHPEEKYRMKKHTEESLKKLQAWVDMKNQEMQEQYKKDEEAGVDVAAKCECFSHIKTILAPDLLLRHARKVCLTSEGRVKTE